jgi:hypothetical protein
LNLQYGNGISFYGHLNAGGLSLVSNLPWPFDKVVDALSKIVIDGIIAVINVVVGSLKFDILLPKFQLPEQNTKLSFSDIAPFGYSRQGGHFSPAERTFIGFGVGVTATK